MITNGGILHCKGNCHNVHISIGDYVMKYYAGELFIGINDAQVHVYFPSEYKIFSQVELAMV